MGRRRVDLSSNINDRALEHNTTDFESTYGDQGIIMGNLPEVFDISEIENFMVKN